jgi:hypothetical protein
MNHQNQAAAEYKAAKKEFDKLIKDGCMAPAVALNFIRAGIKGAKLPNKEYAAMFAGKWVDPVAEAERLAAEKQAEAEAEAAKDQSDGQDDSGNTEGGGQDDGGDKEPVE